MSLTDLSIAAMTKISEAWLDPARLRSELAKLPHVAPLLPDLDDAHAALSKSERGGGGEWDARATAIDATHDRLARGMFNVLSGLADLVDDPEKGAALLHVRDELMPAGLLVVSKSYVEQAVDAEGAQQRLSAESRRLLDGVVVWGKPLSQSLKEWFAAAKHLHEVDAAGQRASRRDPTAELRSARSEWVRVVTAMVQMLEMEKSLDDAARARILAPLETAVSQAGRA